MLLFINTKFGQEILVDVAKQFAFRPQDVYTCIMLTQQHLI